MKKCIIPYFVGSPTIYWPADNDIYCEKLKKQTKLFTTYTTIEYSWKYKKQQQLKPHSKIIK